MTSLIALNLLLSIAIAKAFTIPNFSLATNGIPNAHERKKLSGGGRAPDAPDSISVDEQAEDWGPEPTSDSECRLCILQITDIYTLENLGSFQTLLEQTRVKAKGATVVSMVTGDFLSPYLLASIDRGFGMMRALARIPLDYITWGNHEADQPHKAQVTHVRNFPGKWLNSNMLDHEAMDDQQEYDVIELTSSDGKHTRKVGLCAVLTNDPAVYSHFKAPGAFGGATITDPWEALKKYKRILEEDEGCDVVVPLQHLYVPDDHRTCKEFDFPVVLSGHDHHRVDEVIHGTRLLKPGMNAEYATMLELSWSDSTQDKPNIRAKFVKVDDWAPNPASHEANERAYDALAPLRNTELAQIPESFRPLTSNGSRESVCSMGKLICSMLRTSLNVSRRERQHLVDAVLLMGGNIRGNMDYPDDAFFSLESLEAEIKSDEVVGVVKMPGSVLAAGIEATHAGDPIPGWMQYDEGIVQDVNGKVTHVAGQPLDPERIYRVATKIADLTNGQSWPLTEYFTDNPHLMPPKGTYVNIHAELMGHFARNLWNQLWSAIGDEIMDDDEDACDVYADCGVEQRLEALDMSGDGIITVEEIQMALRDKLGMSVDQRESVLAEFVHSYADTNGDGTVRLQDMEYFCNELGCDVDEVVLVEELAADIKEPLHKASTDSTLLNQV